MLTLDHPSQTLNHRYVQGIHCFRAGAYRYIRFLPSNADTKALRAVSGNVHADCR